MTNAQPLFNVEKTDVFIIIGGDDDDDDVGQFTALHKLTSILRTHIFLFRLHDIVT